MGCEGIRGRTGARAWEVIHIYTGSFTPSPAPTPFYRRLISTRKGGLTTNGIHLLMPASLSNRSGPPQSYAETTGVAGTDHPGEHALGGLYHAGMVTTRTDIPQRTDIEAPIPYRLNKHVLFGQQEGLCAGCRSEFPFRAFEVDHVIPQSRGGTDHIDNLQLLCSSCNRIKGNRSMEYLMARLAEFRQTA